MMPPPTAEITPINTAPTALASNAEAFTAPVTANNPRPAASNSCTGVLKLRWIGELATNTIAAAVNGTTR